jgi:hypothetical protein
MTKGDNLVDHVTHTKKRTFSSSIPPPPSLYTYEVASIRQKAKEVPYKAKPTKSDNMIKPFVDHGNIY